jgi:hypothetical protein
MEGKKKPKSKLSLVQEFDYGVYVYELPTGQYLSDEDGNLLNIPAQRGDVKKMARICEVASVIGFPDGTPVFLQGVRRVSQDEYDDQKERMLNGLTPDPHDIGALRDELRAERQQRNGN